jgi:hypothetical protein
MMYETSDGPGTQAGNLSCFRGVVFSAFLVALKIENLADHSDQDGSTPLGLHSSCRAQYAPHFGLSKPLQNCPFGKP